MIFDFLIFLLNCNVVESAKLRFVTDKAIVPLPGSKVKTLTPSDCPNGCLRECSRTKNVVGCTDAAGVCSVVSDGGVVLQDAVGSKAIINGVLLYLKDQFIKLKLL